MKSDEPPMGFQIYQETGLTPAPASRTAAIVNQTSGKHTIDDKENKRVVTTGTAAGNYVVPAEEEPMAVDWVNIIIFLLF